MNMIPLTQTLHSLSGADQAITALIVLLGALGGWYLGNLNTQLRSKRTVVALKSLRSRRR